MSILPHLPSFPNLMLYLGLLGFILLVIQMLLSLARKEEHAFSGVLVSLIIFVVVLGLLEGPGMIQAKFGTSVVRERSSAPSGAMEKPELKEERAVGLAEPEAPQPSPSEITPAKPAPPAEPAPPLALPPSPSVPKLGPKPGPTIISEPVKPQATPLAPKPEEPLTSKPQPTPSAPEQETPVPKTAPGKGHRMKILASPGETGTIEIEIRGPIVEIAKEHKPSAHLMIVLDGKYALVIPPTRYTEQKKENELGEVLITSVTYFWEKVLAGFDYVPYGPHSVLIDVSLEAPEAHKLKMVGTGNLENDWNGFVQVPEGGSVQLVFGAKNWMSQELERIR